MEMEQQIHLQLQRQQQEAQHQSSQRRSFAPAFNMVPIQVIRNANASERKGLLPSSQDIEGSPPSHGPRAIVGSGRVTAARMPYGQDAAEVHRQMLMREEMMQRRAGMNSPINARPFPAVNSIAVNRGLHISGDALMNQARPLLGHPAPGLQSHGHHSPSLPPTSSAPSDLNSHRMQQIQQLQLVNQQLHQMNPSQLQQTRGMNPAQIQQFLMRS
jgi:hypothetical protein